ncbi:CHAT domain-containing tetratricopeptide repeat protein [Microcystis panniformis]|uniref:Kinesin light chain n=1 Tax=Microcystis panniformis FACHB-1757 TaxID=1638788 RepID=A0A0K1RWD8_9CHRO|nr:tetratricopeptide repeat protein [Microcystis panniformis]AKV66026.1 kinesin light chain [Microcystis panniformis FACHB-1757]
MLYQQGQYEQGIIFAQQTCDLAKSYSLTNEPIYAYSLNLLAILYKSMGRYEQALPLSQQVLEIVGKSLGTDHPEYANCLNKLAVLYQLMGQYEQALPLHQQALKITGKSLGTDHPNYAESLYNLAVLYRSMGQYEQALPLHQQALEIRGKSLGTDHPDYAGSLDNLAILYQLMGQYEQALPLHQQALEILGKSLGTDHPDYAGSLNNLAALYKSMGQYEQALPLHQQALEILGKSLGTDHPDYAGSLNNLAALYKSMGQYEQALPLHQQALAIRGKSLGTDHPEYAGSLNNLAALYKSMGQYEQALPLHQQALEILGKSLGTDHPDYAHALNNLAILYQSMGQYEDALPLLQQVLEIQHKSIGNNHHEYAVCLHILANLYQSIKQYKDALFFYQKALEIERKTIGTDHPHYAACLNDLALLYKSMGEYGEAIPLLQQALKIRHQSLGSKHPHFAYFLYNLALLYTATNHPEEALKLMQEAAEIDLKTISKIFSISTDKQRLNYLEQNYYKVETFLSLVFQHFPNSPEAVQSAYNLILRRKAIATETAILQKIALLSQQYAHLAPKLQQWQQIRQQLAKRCFDIPTPEQLPYYQQEIKSLEQQAENLERELNIPELNLEKELQNADFRTIALELPEGTTLIEFIRFNNYNFQAIPANGDAASFPPRYLAFILPAQAPEQLTMIDLGEAEPIDKLVKEFRESVENPRGLSVAVFKKQEDILSKIELSKLIFDKIKPYLTQELIICPDGELNCLPFEILPTDKGSYLMDEYRCNFLNVGRDILRFKAKIPAKVTYPLVIANPDYNLASPENTPSTAENEEKFPFKPSLRNLATSRQGQIFNSLPGTEIEGEKIAKILRVKPVTAAKALKPLVSKAQKAPYILHIATHGYFLGDITPELDTINQNFMLSSLSASERFQVGTRQNPLLRSGLAFAGVNTMLNGGKLPEKAEDGLLTSLDVQSINLAGTELVVTSACETALGDLYTGETLIGLRRSFIQAGAKTVIISLWKVEDVATTILMQYFYYYLLKAKLSKAEALRKAKSSLQRLTIAKMRSQWLTEDAIKSAEKHSIGTAAHLRELSQKSDLERPYEAPKYWAAFICLGNPAGLPLLPQASKGQNLK